MPRPATPEDAMRGYLTGEDPGLARVRRFMRRIPHGPNCKICAAPFEGLGGAVLKHVGFARFPGNPAICGNCIRDLNKIGVFGAEIPVSLLFADIRGSTGIGERSSPTEFRAFLDSFYRLSQRAILDHDGIVDKFVGDEVIGLFIPVLAGELHASRAVSAGRQLLARTADWIAVGAGVNTGIAFVGAVGPDDSAEFTAMGDPVNVAARLASAAAAGELLVPNPAVEGAQLDGAGLEHRSLELKGKSELTEVVVLGAA